VTDDVITWVFDEDSFSPVAKLRADKKYSILSDYLGTPTHVFNDGGEVIWEAALDSYGKLRVEKGTLGSCPYRYQGQYEDFETGFFFNLNRYYSPEEGNYISQDPLELESEEPGFYNYVGDPNTWIDIFGLHKNAHLANSQHPVTKVPFNSKGYPNFKDHLYKGQDGKNDVRIKLTGSRRKDFAAANKKAGFKKTPKGYTWHHHESTGRMQLVNRKIHAKTGHAGGFSKHKKSSCK
jgi:RHS repeat-associated protein